MIQKEIISDGHLLSSSYFDNLSNDDNHMSNLFSCYNLWSYKYPILVKRFISFKQYNFYFFHIAFQHYKRRKISRVKVVLFADHGPKDVSFPDIDAELLKQHDIYRYNYLLREGAFYILDIPVDNSRECVCFSCGGIAIDEVVPLTFSTLYYHDESYLDVNHFQDVGPFETVKISCLVNLPQPLKCTVDGLKISEVHSGDVLARGVTKTLGWQPIVMFRTADGEGKIQLSFELTGIGMAYILVARDSAQFFEIRRLNVVRFLREAGLYLVEKNLPL